MWRMTRIYVEYDWVLKVLRIVFRISSLRIRRLSLGDVLLMCIRGLCLCIDVIKGICTVHSFEFKKIWGAYNCRSIDMDCLLRV